MLCASLYKSTCLCHYGGHVLESSSGRWSVHEHEFKMSEAAVSSDIRQEANSALMEVDKGSYQPYC